MIGNIYFYYFYLISSIFTIGYTYFKDRKQLHIKWDGIAKFLAFMSLLTMYRFCLFDSFMNINSFQRLPIQMGNFLLVFLEDAFFVMIPYYITRNRGNGFFKFVIWAFFSILFAYGHIYQGYFVALITGLYPYFVSRKYALKTSFITVMACHFLYDCLTFLTLKMAKIFTLMKPWL